MVKYCNIEYVTCCNGVYDMSQANDQNCAMYCGLTVPRSLSLLDSSLVGNFRVLSLQIALTHREQPCLQSLQTALSLKQVWEVVLGYFNRPSCLCFLFPIMNLDHGIFPFFLVHFDTKK